MRERSLKLALGQMLVEGGAVEANLDRALAMIHEATRSGCHIIVLPECLDLGWMHPSARRCSEPIPGSRTARFAQAAASAKIHVAAGFTERDGDRLYNAAVLIDSGGRILLKHRKINVLDIAQGLYEIGDRLQVAHTDLGVLGLDICADNFPNSLDIGRTIGRMGAHLLLSPSAWAVDADHDNRSDPYGGLWLDSYSQLAKQFQMPVAGVSNVGPITAGPWAGRRCIGCSMLIDSDGNQLVMGPADEEALIVAEVRLAHDRPKGTKISGML
jgi:predicted amidohydrolase